MMSDEKEYDRKVGINGSKEIDGGNDSAKAEDSNHTDTWMQHIIVEEKSILKLALPIMGSQFLNFLLNLVDLAMVGKLGRDELAAASLGGAYFNTVFFPLTGVAMALDTLLSQSYGAKQYTLFGEWLVSGCAVMGVLCIPVIIIMLLAPVIFVALGLEDQLAQQAGQFVMLLVPGVLPIIFFMLFTKYLQHVLVCIDMFLMAQACTQAQHILAPGVWLSAAANVFNVICNYILIYASGLGLVGAPIATSITRYAQFFALLAYLHFAKSHKRTWPAWNASSLHWSNSIRFIELGMTGAVMIALEAWCFDLSYFLVAFLGTVALDAHSALLTLCGFTYMSFLLGISIATSIRVGNLLGAGQAKEAQLSAKLSLLTAFVFSSTLCVMQIVFRDRIGWIFSNDAEVIALVSTLVPISALYQVSDGSQSALAGIFRGMGRQKTVVALNLVGFWVIGMSVGVLLTFFVGGTDNGLGVAGVYWGLFTGLTCTSIFGFVMLSKTDWNHQVALAADRLGIRGKQDASRSSDVGMIVLEAHSESDSASLVQQAGSA